VHVHDLTGGFKFIRREVLERIDLSSLRAQGYVFNIELTYRALMLGCSVQEIPIVFRDRKEGRSKMSLPVAIEALFLVPRLRRSHHQALAASRAEETAAA
jgi:dolichol-phosphate mannosyltransferase